MNFIYIEISERIGISQKELADCCNFEKSNSLRIEVGRTNLTLKSPFLISKNLHILLKISLNRIKLNKKLCTILYKKSKITATKIFELECGFFSKN